MLSGKIFIQFAYRRPDIFEDIPPLCATTHTLITEVFPHPDVVMAKLVLSIYQGKLKVRRRGKWGHLGEVIMGK